jgi:hypothetical protein
MATHERAHPVRKRFLRAGEQHPDVEVLEPPAVSLRQSQRGRDAGSVVVRARGDGGEGDVDQQRQRRDQHHGGHELDRGEDDALDTGHSQDRAGEHGEHRPEQRMEGADRAAYALADRRAALLDTAAEGEPRATGVVVGHEDHGPRLVAVLARDDVLRGPSPEQPP